MLDKNIFFLASMVVLFPFISGLVRLNKISRQYRPFIILLTIAVMTEIASRILIEYSQNNTAIINIYSLIEGLLIISQFYYWRYHSRTRIWYPYFGLLCILIWITENLVIGSIDILGPVFRISSAFVLVVLTINELNYLIINENRNLLKNARFLICTGFLIYFLYQILLEGAFYISAKQKNSTADQIIKLSVYINVLANIIYGIAIWYIPKRTNFSIKERMENQLAENPLSS
jgi:hypothetical protein